jgi:GTP pyrophosphokinase
LNTTLNTTPDPAPPTEDLRPERARALASPLYGERRLETGEELAEHAHGLAQVLAGVRPDADLLVACELFALHDVLRDADRWVRESFGARVARLVGDLRQLRQLSASMRTRAGAPGGAAQDEALRRMLLAMVNDMRVVLLLLASSLQTLRHFAVLKDAVAARPFAEQARALYAPLANRLGIWQLKWELEDLALRFLEPATYQRVARQLEEKRGQREARVLSALNTLQGMLREAGVAGEVSGRPKHIASIVAKMTAKQLAFEQVLDQSALRVVVAGVGDCYEVLARVNARWEPIDGEMDDYIARPKANGYQSLHTVVRDDDGRPLEIQIRTRAMHEQAELGMAAHWRYKEGGSDGDDGRVAWLRQLLDWQRELELPGLREAAIPAAVYALTPQGRVLELPAGATAVDFAYLIHTELGHRCRGARVDGALVALNTPLRTGQTVEVVTARSGGPSRDWLNPELGFLASARSRTKVRQWFHAQEHAQSVAAGRELIGRELQRLGRTAVSLEDLAHRLGFPGVEDLCVAATKDEFSLRSLEQALAPAESASAHAEPALETTRPAAPARGDVLVLGVDDLLTSLAQCCHPIPPDPIIGFVTRGRGVSVHRSRCPNASALMKRHPERVIEVQWEGMRGSEPGAYPVQILVLAADRQGLLRDISEVFAREKINVTGVNTASRADQARMQFTIEVGEEQMLRRALAQLSEVRGVTVARRL